MNKAETVKVIGIVTLMGIVIPNYWEGDNCLKFSFDEESILIRKWLSENNYHYYAQPKESFFKWEGIQQAIDGDFNGVVLENMS